jgi:hypothetical protein
VQAGGGDDGAEQHCAVRARRVRGGGPQRRGARLHQRRHACQHAHLRRLQSELRVYERQESVVARLPAADPKAEELARQQLAVQRRGAAAQPLAHARHRLVAWWLGTFPGRPRACASSCGAGGVDAGGAPGWRGGERQLLQLRTPAGGGAAPRAARVAARCAGAAALRICVPKP